MLIFDHVVSTLVGDRGTDQIQMEPSAALGTLVEASEVTLDIERSRLALKFADQSIGSRAIRLMPQPLRYKVLGRVTTFPSQN